MSIEFSRLPPAASANLTDLLAASQSNNDGTYTSRKVTQQQAISLAAQTLPLNTQYKGALKYCTSAALSNVVYNNGNNGVGATITCDIAQFSGNTLAAGDNVMVKDELFALAHCGAYAVTSIGSPAGKMVLTRLNYYDGSPAGQVNFGDVFEIIYGANGSATKWQYFIQINTSADISVGSGPIVFGPWKAPAVPGAAVSTITGDYTIQPYDLGNVIFSNAVSNNVISLVADSQFHSNIYFDPNNYYNITIVSTNSMASVSVALGGAAVLIALDGSVASAGPFYAMLLSRRPGQDSEWTLRNFNYLTFGYWPLEMPMGMFYGAPDAPASIGQNATAALNYYRSWRFSAGTSVLNAVSNNRIIMPENWDGGPVLFQLSAKTPATSGTALFLINAICRGAGDPESIAFTAPVTCYVIAQAAPLNAILTATSDPILPQQSPAGGNELELRISRTAQSGGDNLANYVDITAITMFYNINAGSAS